MGISSQAAGHRTLVPQLVKVSVRKRVRKVESHQARVTVPRLADPMTESGKTDDIREVPALTLIVCPSAIGHVTC